MAGGQPISLANLHQLRSWCDQHKVLLVHDMTRVAENAYFIQQREEQYKERSIREIVFEICSLTDVATMSSKKDAMVNIGGFLAMNDPALYEQACALVVVYEGLHTYGGMAGRDMEALAIGITESVDDDHIRARVGQVEYLGEQLERAGIPIVTPICFHTYRKIASPPRHWRRRCIWNPVFAPWSAAWYRPGATRLRARTTCRSWNWYD